jgi:hypothetical protein
MIAAIIICFLIIGAVVPIGIWAISVRKKEAEETKKEAEKQRKELVIKKLETRDKALKYLAHMQEGTRLSYSFNAMGVKQACTITIEKITNDSVSYSHFPSGGTLTEDKNSFAFHYGELIVRYFDNDRKNKEQAMKREALRIVMEELKVGDRICYFKKEWNEKLATKDSYLIVKQVEEHTVKYELEGITNREYNISKDEFADKFFLGILEAYYEKTGH